MRTRTRGRGLWFLAALLALVTALHLGGIEAADRWAWTRQFDVWELLEIDRPPDPVEEVEVAWIEMPATETPEIELPDPEADVVPPEETRREEARERVKMPELALAPPPKPTRPEPEPEPEKKPPEPEPEKKPPEPEPEKPKPIPPPEVVAKPPTPPPPKPAQPMPIPRMKKVEVDDEQNVVDEPPPDAQYLSDRNRRVAQETRATETNLQRESKGKTPPSAKSEDRTSEEIGGPDDKVRHLEESEPTSLDAKRREVASVHHGTSDRAEGMRSGERGQEGAGGERGEGGGGGQGGEPGALSMRNVDGIGAPGRGQAIEVTPHGGGDGLEVATSTAPRDPAGAPGREGAPGKKGKRGLPNLRVDTETYERIVGSERMREEQELAKRQRSHKKGRWEKKLSAVRSSLENFTPEVRPGNQTALNTRAHPFAVYIARMHRSIHEIWAYGFLADLDHKGFSNPMNDRTLAVKMEIVIRPDGSVKKVTIAKPSGVLTFDVAAVDTVISAGPYQATPPEIRSSDGNVYLHWTFHRDERMCNHYFADPYIIEGLKGDDQDEGAEPSLPGPEDAIAGKKKRRGAPRELKREPGDPTEGGVPVPRVTREELPEGEGAAAPVANPEDPGAVEAALAWGNAFEKGDVAGLIAASDTPFVSAGRVVAENRAGLETIYKTVLGEVRKRRIDQWKIFSAAGYRAVFGTLPPGAEDGTPMLFLVVQVGSERLTMNVLPKGGGTFKIVGLNRH